MGNFCVKFQITRSEASTDALFALVLNAVPQAKNIEIVERRCGRALIGFVVFPTSALSLREAYEGAGGLQEGAYAPDNPGCRKNIRFVATPDVVYAGVTYCHHLGNYCVGMGTDHQWSLCDLTGSFADFLESEVKRLTSQLEASSTREKDLGDTLARLEKVVCDFRDRVTNLEGAIRDAIRTLLWTRRFFKSKTIRNIRIALEGVIK